jgi:hypothetical protein
MSMKRELVLLLLSLGITSTPAANAQFQSAAPVAGVTADNMLTLTGTGLGLSTPLSTRDMLSNEYGITLPQSYNNTIPCLDQTLSVRLGVGCFGNCFF